MDFKKKIGQLLKTLKIVSDLFTGRVEVHFNQGRVLKVKKIEEIK